MRQYLLTSDLFLKAQTDERLAALCREGHGRAFTVLVDRHRRVLLGHAGRLVGSERAEDVVQQALLKAWRSLQEGADVKHAQAWLHRIVHNTALTEIERNPQSAGPLDESDGIGAHRESAASAAEQRMELLQVLRGLADLPQRERLALLGTELEGRSRRQLASELGLSEGAVRQLVYRARRRVRAGIAVLVPFPLLDRAARAWARDAGAAGQAGAAPAAALKGSGVLAGATAKVAAAVIAAGAVSGAVLLHAHGGAHGGGSPHVSVLTQAGHGTKPASIPPSRTTAATAAPILALVQQRLRRRFPAGAPDRVRSATAPPVRPRQSPTHAQNRTESSRTNVPSPPVTVVEPPSTQTSHDAAPSTSHDGSQSPSHDTSSPSTSTTDTTSSTDTTATTGSQTTTSQQDTTTTTTTTTTQSDHADAQTGTTTTGSSTDN